LRRYLRPLVSLGGAPKPGFDGNWACPQCHNVNYAVREECNRCTYPKPGEEDELGHAATALASASSAHGAPVAGVDGNWSCPTCKNVNFAYRTACNRCQTSKQQVQQQKGAPATGVAGNWSCPYCQNVNYAVRTACNRCQAPKPQQASAGSKRGAPVAGVDGNWCCMGCGNVNFAMRTVCNRCEAEKVEDEGLGEPAEKRIKSE